MTPSAALEHLVDRAADEILFGNAMIELPTQALRSLTVDIAATCMIRDPLVVERRLLLEFRMRLDQRLRAAVDDDVGGARWRALLKELEVCFPTRR
jgi:D-serine deaminase-like pyridoxal phosphate-dependent protein